MGSPIPIWEKSPNNPVFFLGALPSQIPRPSCESLNLNILGCVCVFSPCGGRLCVSSQPECCQCNQPTSVLVTFLLNTPTIWLLSRYCLIAMQTPVVNKQEVYVGGRRYVQVPCCGVNVLESVFQDCVFQNLVKLQYFGICVLSPLPDP